MTPTPPSCASAIASAASVTVSIGADTSGMFNSIWRVSFVRVSASEGTKSLRAGISSTSSKVIPSCWILGCSMGKDYGPRPPKSRISAPGRRHIAMCHVAHCNSAPRPRSSRSGTRRYTAIHGAKAAIHHAPPMTHHPSTPIHDHDRLHLEFALSPDDYVRANMLVSRPLLWRRTRLYSVLAVTFAVIAWTRTMPDWLLIWMLPVVYAASALSIVPMTRYQLRLAYRSRRGLQAINRVTLSAEGYRTDSGGTELLVRWHAFS